MKQKVYVVVGPTAVGKTALGVRLAQKLGGEVVSADSMQVYRGMDIGTAKPTLEERGGIPHHMLDIVEPDDAYSVARYQAQAQDCIAEIHSRGMLPVLVGGTGLYVNSITYRLSFPHTHTDHAARAQWDGFDNQSVYAILEQLDAQAAARIHPNNRVRVLRAIEIAQSGHAGEYNFARESDAYQFEMVGLTAERGALYARINSRVDGMLADGLVDEVRGLLDKYGREQTSMQAIGYKELAAFFSGETTMEEAVERIRRNTRKFAKRQFTWFRRDTRIRWLDVEGRATDDIIEDILKGY